MSLTIDQIEVVYERVRAHYHQLAEQLEAEGHLSSVPKHRLEGATDLHTELLLELGISRASQAWGESRQGDE